MIKEKRIKETLFQKTRLEWPLLHSKPLPLKHPLFCLIPKPWFSRTNVEFVFPLLNKTHQKNGPLWTPTIPTPTSVWDLFLNRERVFLSWTSAWEKASVGSRYSGWQATIFPVIVSKVGSSTPQSGAKTSVKLSDDGLQFTVLLLVQFPLQKLTNCSAMHPRPALLLRWESFMVVRFLLMISTISLAGFPVEVKKKLNKLQIHPAKRKWNGNCFHEVITNFNIIIYILWCYESFQYPLSKIKENDMPLIIHNSKPIKTSIYDKAISSKLSSHNAKIKFPRTHNLKWTTGNQHHAHPL